MMTLFTVRFFCWSIFLLAYSSAHKIVRGQPELLDAIYNITNSEYQALVDLYDATTGWEWVWSDGPDIPWNFTDYTNPCLDFWQGVTCSNSTEDGYLHVIELDLTDYGLDGFLPQSIGNLVYLETLALSYNELYAGIIPGSIGQLIKLTTLQLHDTSVNGSFPDSIGNLVELVILDLGDNNLFGSIPVGVCYLTQLVELDISGNLLSGTIPECFGGFPNLQYLTMYDNLLGGPIPASLGYLTNLVSLQLFNNYLTGSLPNTLSALINLTILDFAFNEIAGTIPSWVGNFVALTAFHANTNQLDGTIPAEVGNWHQLTTFYIFSNDFTGTLPLSMANLVKLMYFNIAANRISGPCPAYLGNFTNLYYLTLFDNHLTGTFPADIGRATNLLELNVGANRMEGPLPSDLWKCVILVGFVFSHNQFTGTVPESLLSLPLLHGIEIGLNHLSGQLPEAPATSTVAFYSAGYNHLTGTIPASFANVEKLVYLNLSYNYLTSTMPAEITLLVKLNFLYLSSNFLTGPLPLHWDTMSVLSYVFMSENFFSGNIPSSFGGAQLLISLNLSHNHLTGTIPTEFSRLLQLEVLLLQDNVLVGNIYNVLNSSYQQNLSTLQFSNNQLTGTLPAELFLSNTLKVFAAVSNCFTGSIPLSLCNSTSINTLVLDGLQSATSCHRALFPASLNGIVAKGLYTIGNPLSGGVPSCLFEMPQLTTLHLSGNGLTGSITENISISPTLTDLSLSHNKLTGRIPSVLLTHPWTSLDLSYNVFKHSLPQDDRKVYSRNASIYFEQNRLSGDIPDMFADVESISVLESNLFACNAQGDDLPSHDPNIGRYQCGSDTLNETLYAWLTVACCVLVVSVLGWRWRRIVEDVMSIDLELVLIWWHRASAVAELARYTEVNAVIEVIIRLCSLSTLWCTCILLPIYIVMSTAYGTYTHQYAWTLSAAYLSGTVPFALMFTFLTLLVAACYFYFRRLIRILAVGPKSDVTSTPSQSAHYSSKTYRFIVFACYILLTFAVVLGVNIAYVVIALNENGNVLTLAQFVLALFKVGFNSMCSPLLIRWISHYILYDSDSREFVSIQLIVGLVNNIAIPGLVVAIISPSCFYNIFEAAESVESTYFYNGRCLTYNKDSTVIVTCQEAQVLQATTSYDPPFEYSYQCSSSFITYYAPAYVIMCILAGVAIPVVQVSLQVLHARATPGTRWFALLDLVLPRILKPTNTASSQSMFVLYFDAQQHLTTILNYLGLLLTFGAVFPPLAICFLITMCSIAAFAKLKVGRFLHNAGAENATYCTQIINDTCAGAGNVVKLHRAVLTVLVFSCVFYTLFLFDTYGDSVGFAGAYWILIVVPLIPLSLYFVVASALVAKQVRSESIAGEAILPDTIRGEAKAAGDVELQHLENGAIQNPMVSMNTL